MLTDTGTLVDLNSVTHGLLAREKSAATSNVPLRIPADDDDSYQKKCHKGNGGTEAWIQAYREIRLVCQFNYDVHRNRFVLNTDPRYVKKVEVSPQLAYILGFNNTEFMPGRKRGKKNVLFLNTEHGGTDKTLAKNNVTRHYYIGCFAADQIPAGAIVKFPHCMVVNLDPSTSHGSHWVCIYCASPLHLEYYDSLGMWPPPSVHISANSSACGRHVIFFLYCRCVGMTFEKIVNFLHFGKQQPDTLRKFQLKMHVDFDPLQVDWSAFSSECVQFGGYNIYRGLPYQRGAGVGAVFRSLMRYLLPIGKQIGSAIGRQGMESGNRVLTNVLEGKDLKESLVSESKWPEHFLSSADQRVRCSLILSTGIGQTFVQQLKVTVGNTEVYDSGNLYPFKAYITNELSFPINAKKNFLGSTGYYHTVNKMIQQTRGSKSVKQPATYAVRKTEIKSSFISVGRYEFEYNVFSATIPRRVTIALVGNSAFHGDYKLSPFMFEPFDLREISDHFVSAFVDMYEALGMANRNVHLTFQWPSSRKAVEKRYDKRTSNIQFTNSTWWRGDDCLGPSLSTTRHCSNCSTAASTTRSRSPKLRGQIEDAEEDLLLNWWRQDPTIICFLLDTVERLASKQHFFSAPNMRPRSCANTPRTNNVKGEIKIIVAFIPPPPKLNGERISPRAHILSEVFSTPRPLHHAHQNSPHPGSAAMARGGPRPPGRRNGGEGAAAVERGGPGRRSTEGCGGGRGSRERVSVEERGSVAAPPDGRRKWWGGVRSSKERGSVEESGPCRLTAEWWGGGRCSSERGSVEERGSAPTDGRMVGRGPRQ
ncbi:hypothetical protein niasHT_036144 [Heterodera trifolii]|uniref:Uncharacterized protein n=1 Tax=Heterodera trifolii TaxID=157864 RepID=A0ABD2HZL5_9BILA